MALGPAPPQSTVSLSDLLTTVKNLVQSINNQAITNQNVTSGLTNAAGITSPTVIKTGPGNVAGISVIVAGAPGLIYDASTASDTSSPLLVIPNTTGYISTPHAVTKGIFVQPGGGQTVTVFFS